MIDKELIINLKKTYRLLKHKQHFNESEVDFMFHSVEIALDCLETIFEDELWK